MAHATPPAPGDDAFSLMREQAVTEVGKRPLPLSETPSSVTVITGAEIRAMGYRSLGDALRWVRGVFVTYDRDYTYVGVRGLQRPGDFNNKILLTLDGHTMNGSVYGDAFFGPELGLDLADVERIEIARGPGSALYGSYAVLAIVNVVTRHPHSEPGASADLRAGGAGEWLGHATVASAPPGRPEWHASLSWLQATGRTLTFEDPSLVPGTVSVRDGERALSFFAAAEWGPVRLSTKFNDREKTLPPASYALVSGGDHSTSWDGHDFVELSAAGRTGPALDLTGRAWWDGSRYRSRALQASGSDVVVNQDLGVGDVLGAECRAHWAPAAGQALTLGVEGRRTLRIHLRNYDEVPYWLYDDQRMTGDLFATYVQDELRFAQRVILTAGARLDNDRSYPAVVSPRVDLVWTIAPGTRLKALGGSAFRAPSPFELVQRSPTLGGRLGCERVVTLEGTLEHDTGPCTVYLSGYGSRFRDLIDLVELDTTGTTSYVNLGRVRSHGVEGGLRFTPSAGTHARLAVAWQRSEDGETGAELTNSPPWNAHVLAYHGLGDRRTTVGAGVRYLSPRLAAPGHRSLAALVCDARVARALDPGLVVGFEVRNLFDARYGDPGWGEHLGDETAQDPRSLYVTLSYAAPKTR